nr:diaminopimelate epimerase [Parachlamydiaceae bacterium]
TQHICHRQNGIGADGLIFLENSTGKSPYRMRIFNADGSEAEMCGNGLRCLAQLIRSTENICKGFSIETMHQSMDISWNSGNPDLVSIDMPSPTSLRQKKLTVKKDEVSVHCLDTGVPHAVLFVDDLEDHQHFSIAPHIRFHQEFHPKGTNVNFAKLLDDQSVEIRTYERGVEAETLACGTGAVAVAIASAHAFNMKAPIKIRTRSGDHLYINFKNKIPHLTGLVMTGPAIKIFDGFIDIEKFGFQLKSSSPIR